MVEESAKQGWSLFWAWFTGAPLRIIGIVVLGFLTVVLGRWLLARLVRGVGRAPLPRVDRSGKVVVTLGAVPSNQHRTARLRTLQQILSSSIGVVVAAVVITVVLAELGIDIAPIIATAGVAGIAIAFGAQSLVSDVFAGLFMLAENQYNVGDRVELGALGSVLAAGTIEGVGLRVTEVRDDDGRLWYVRNGQILRVANESHGWSVAMVDVALAPDVDVESIRDQVDALLVEVLQEPALAKIALPGHAPSVRIADISAEAAVLSLRVRAEPGQSAPLASILRQRLYRYVSSHNIQLATKG